MQNGKYEIDSGRARKSDSVPLFRNWSANRNDEGKTDQQPDLGWERNYIPKLLDAHDGKLKLQKSKYTQINEGEGH